MSQMIVAASRTNCEWLTRDWSNYSLKRFDGDGKCVGVEPLSKSQAEAYYRNNPNGHTVGHERVRFDGFGGQFTYRVDRHDSPPVISEGR